MQLQRTIEKVVSYRGTGLHLGREVTLTLESAPPGSGIVFVREDLPGSPQIKTSVNKVVSNVRGTSLGEGKTRVRTVEHILAALAGLGIDNINIKMNEEEVPAGDGSALPFVKLIQEAGIVEQATRRRFLKIKEPLWIEEEDRRLIVLPYDGLRITYTVDFTNYIFN
jgi:UDP-3-O-acyl N-acetylglucosamine deacetylase